MNENMNGATNKKHVVLNSVCRYATISYLTLDTSFRSNLRSSIR